MESAGSTVPVSEEPTVEVPPVVFPAHDVQYYDDIAVDGMLSDQDFMAMMDEICPVANEVIEGHGAFAMAFTQMLVNQETDNPPAVNDSKNK